MALPVDQPKSAPLPGEPEIAAPVAPHQEPISEKRGNSLEVRSIDKNEGDDSGSEHKQEGVRQVEAITKVWSKQLLIVMFVLLFVVSFTQDMLQAVQGNLVPYITSSFGKHSLLAATSVVSRLLGGVLAVPISKVIDIWGRCEGFCAMLALVTVGMVMKATCTTVEMYAAAHTIYWIGHSGMSYVITIMLADITTLRNRLVMFGIAGTPLIATVFGGPPIAQLFYDRADFRWAFGAFLIILLFFAIPICAIFIFSKRKAVRMGLFPENVNHGDAWETTKFYVVQFDLAGMLLLVVGSCLFLLSFSLVTYAPDGWKSGYIIAMMVLGLLLLVTFGLYERFLCPVPLIPWRYLQDRTILASCSLWGIMFLSVFCWNTFYGSYLQAVHNMSTTLSGIVLNCFSLASAVVGPFVGLFVRYTGSYKWTAIAGVPFVVLGTALLIHFRVPEPTTNWLVMCQIFVGIGRASLAIMAAVSHNEVAIGIALHALFGAFGGAIGQAIAGAMWNDMLPGNSRCSYLTRRRARRRPSLAA